MFAHKITFIAVILIGFCLMAGCDDDNPFAPDYTDPNEVLDVNSGAFFLITVHANATTGYEWFLAQTLDSARVMFLGKDYIGDPNPDGLCGVGGREVWCFGAVSSGETTIRMKHCQMGDTTIVEDTLSVSVNIH